jgi:hypothetical protein
MDARDIVRTERREAGSTPGSSGRDDAAVGMTPPSDKAAVGLTKVWSINFHSYMGAETCPATWPAPPIHWILSN